MLQLPLSKLIHRFPNSCLWNAFHYESQATIRDQRGQEGIPPPPPLLSADKITYFRANGAVLGPLTNTDIEGVAIPKLCSF